MLSSIVLLCLAVTSSVRASPAGPHVVHEHATDSRDKWSKLGTIQRDGLLPVRIGLTQRNLESGHDLLMELSDPNSSKYGQHLSDEDVAAMFAPHDDSVQAVYKWLESEGIDVDRVSRSHNLQWIQFHANVSELEQLLHTTYDVYEHKDTGERVVGSDEYSIPKAVQKHIDYITPAVTKLRIPSGKKPKHPRSSPQRPSLREAAQSADKLNVTNNCYKYITPRCIMERYEIPPGDCAVEGNHLGMYEVDTFSQRALSSWFSKYYPAIPEDTKPIANSIDGGVIHSGKWPSLGEAQLDLECAYPIIWPQNIRDLSVDDPHYAWRSRYPNGYFNTFLDALDGSYCNRTAFGITGDSPKFDPTYPDKHKNGYDHPEMCGRFKPPNVISISYIPAEFHRTVAYDRRQCSEWMKLALQGVTVFAASGDYGVSAYGEDCEKDAHGNETIFAPGTPSNCPYVVGVGATTLKRGPDSTADPRTGREVAVDTFRSSGGFSNIYTTPSWQKDAVEQYFREEPPPFKSYRTKFRKNVGAGGGRFNRAGRGIPDISAIGLKIVVVDEYNGKLTSFLSGGTSASAPYVAAMFNRINGERLKAGKPTVGFILPALYANPGMFTDVTVGDNGDIDAEDNMGCGTKGFKAAKGWDPVTGLGTPSYPKMLDYFMNMGTK